MKKAVLLFFASGIGVYSFANTPGNNFKIVSNDSLHQAKKYSLADMLSEIVQVTGITANFELKEADVLNLEASISHQKRYILYNEEFVDRLNSLTRDRWASMALLAHEVGHHLNGHTIRKKGSRPTLELEADEFAGFVLRKLGATLEQSQIVMHYVAKAEASKTHPSKSARLDAIEKGWNRADDTFAKNNH